MAEVALKIDRSKDEKTPQRKGFLNVVRVDPEIQYWWAEEKYNCLVSNFDWFMRHEGMPYDREEELIKTRIDQN